MKIIPYGRQTITDDDIAAVGAVLKSDFLTQGPAIYDFERAFAAYIGVKHALAVSNGTAALHLCAMALDVKPGDRWITTPITFAASANCIRYCGGEIAFCDIDSETGLIDLVQLENMLALKPLGYFKGVIPVDLAGHPVNLEKVKDLADQYQLKIIEDSCHSPGGFFEDRNGNSQNCGNGMFADLAIFSFHPVKHIAAGEGGMITTNSDELANKIKLLRTHGITKDPDLMQQNHGGWFYEMQELGYNYRLTDIQAALAHSQLKRANVNIARRRSIAASYDQAFDQIEEITILSRKFRIGHAFHLYVVLTKKRKEFYEYLKSNQIIAQVHYIPVHTLPYYRQLYNQNISLPKAEKYYEQCISLPMYPGMTEDEVNYVIETIKKFNF